MLPLAAFSDCLRACFSGLTLLVLPSLLCLTFIQNSNLKLLWNYWPCLSNSLSQTEMKKLVLADFPPFPSSFLMHLHSVKHLSPSLSPEEMCMILIIDLSYKMILQRIMLVFNLEGMSSVLKSVEQDLN